LAGFEMFANAFIGAINIIIRGMNIINPFTDIGSLPTISLGRIGGGGGSVTATPRTADRAAREAGTTMPTVPAIIAGGSGGGGGGAGGGGGGQSGAHVSDRPSTISASNVSVSRFDNIWYG
jgi:hypothetical protein